MAKTFKGLRVYRTKVNPLERRFAEAWARANEGGGHLDHILDGRKVQGGRTPECSDRDQVVAATIIQWLGSPVGQSFLREVGYINTEYNPPSNPSILEKLTHALAPLANIADRYDQNGLDEARPSWNDGLAHDLKEELYTGRGGRCLLTLADAFKARQALREVKG